MRGPRTPRNQAYVDRLDEWVYGSAFILEPYIRAQWTKEFEVVAHYKALDAWQDYTILRRI